MDLCNCNSNSSRDDLRLVRGNDFSIIYPINAKYPDGSTVEDFDLHECTDLVVLIKRDSSTAKDIMTYAEGYTITGDKELTVAYDGLKMKLGSYRLDISGKFGGKDWRSYSKDEGFGIVESNEEANIPVGAFIADGVYTVICDFLMTYQTQEQADWEESDTSLPSYIKNKPTIPTTLSELESDSTHRTVTDSDKAYWDAKSDFSGSYDDLTNKPTIPEELSDLSDDSTHRLVTDSEKNSWDSKYTKPNTGIPASDLASGVIPDVSQFITNSVNDLVNYYTKSQTYTQSEVNNLIAGISSFEYEVVSTLPTASASTMHKIYLTPSSDPQTQNVKDEYITIQSGSTYSWEQIGSTAISLDGYVTTTDLNTALAGYQTKIDSSHKLDYSLLSNTPTIPDAQIQSDWNQTTTTAKDFIKNKPTIPSVVDSLSSASTTSALSANQGKVLDESKQATIDATHKLSADLVDDASTTNKFVTASDISTWNGKANKVLVNNHGTDDTTYSATPNTLHIWGTVASLTLTLATPTDNTIVNEYMIEFVSGSTATTLSLPSSVEWAESCGALSVEASKTYQISIVNNIGLWAAISNS